MYPASAQRCCLIASGAGRSTTIESRVAARSLESCRLAPATTSDSGMPLPSVSKLRLRPFFSPVRRIATDAPGCQGRFAQRPIDALPLPGDPVHAVVFRKTSLPDPHEEPGLFPLLEAFVNSTGAAELTRQRFPLNTRAQHEDDGLEDLALGQGFAPSAGLAPIVLVIASRDTPGNQRLNLLPKGVGYRPGFDLCHAVDNIFEKLEIKIYLRISSKKQAPGVQKNGIWIVYTHPDSYTPKELKELTSLVEDSKNGAFILFTCRASELPNGWKKAQ